MNPFETKFMQILMNDDTSSLYDLIINNKHIVKPDLHYCYCYDGQGDTIIQRVVRNGTIDMLRMLISVGYNVNLMGMCFPSPVQLAAILGRTDMFFEIIDSNDFAWDWHNDEFPSIKECAEIGGDDPIISYVDACMNVYRNPKRSREFDSIDETILKRRRKEESDDEEIYVSLFPQTQ